MNPASSGANGVLLAPDSDAAARARHVVGERLAGAGRSDLVDDAQLVATELVTNAVLHGIPPVRLVVEIDGDCVRVEVSDSSPATPVRGIGGESAMTGRGLLLVEAVCSRWGVDRVADGKIVWAELTPDGAIGSTVSAEELLDLWSLGEPALDDPSRARYSVEIPDIPTELLLAAKTHVDNVIREFTLAATGAQAGSTAAVPRHLRELLNAVVSGFAEPRQEIKRQALAAAERGDERTRLHLRVPLEAAAAGEAYLAALDEVDTYCRAARLLTLESPPQYRLFRRWYVEELIRQVRTAASGRPIPRPLTFEARLLAELDTVSEAQRNSDRAARLYRVAAALAGVLSVEEVADIVLAEAVGALDAAAGGLVVPAGGGHLAVRGAVGYAPNLVDRIEEESTDAPLPAARALATGEAVWLESREERDRRFPELTGLEPTTVSMCVVPLESGGRRLGVLRFSFTEPRLFDDKERAFVLALAAQAAQALDRGRGYEAEQRAVRRTDLLAERLRLLADTSDALAAVALDVTATLTEAIRVVVPRLADWGVAHLLVDRVAGRQLKPVAVWHADPGQVAPATELLLRHPVDVDGDGGGAVAECVRTGRSSILDDPARQLIEPAPADASYRHELARLGCRSALVVPLRTSGAGFGTLTLFSASSDRLYGSDELSLAEEVAKRASLFADNARLYASARETALALQRALLPPQLPAIDWLDVAAAYYPIAAGSDVGGDFYDIWSVGEDTWAFAIGDVSGTGPLAAGHTATVRYTMRALTMTDTDPARVVRRLNDALLRVPAPGGYTDRFCTAVLGFASPTDDGVRVRIANAGHPPPLLCGPGTVRELGFGGGLLGLLEDVEPVTDEFTIAPGEALLLYTDGVIESHRGGNDHEARLLAAVKATVCDARSLCAAAEQVALHGTGGRAEDDVAILVVGAPRRRQVGGTTASAAPAAKPRTQ